MGKASESISVKEIWRSFSFPRNRFVMKVVRNVRDRIVIIAQNALIANT